MFERSMVISQVSRVSAGERWTWAGSMVLQGCAAALLITVPLLHPERIVLTATAPKISLPVEAAKLPKIKVVPVSRSSAAGTVAAVMAPGPRAMTAPPTIPHGISAGDPPPMSVSGFMQGSGPGLPAAVAEALPTPRVGVVTAEAHGPLRVSSGVGAGMLLAPIRPVYPSIARAAGVQGVVVVAAVISKEGRIERAHVVSGPAMLASAALDAVKVARYAPYRLNGTATEVETTITVNFRMGS